jgi:hypothetical protein
MKEAINIVLHGGEKGRDIAKITMCDKKDVCSFYKKGQCICIPRPLNGFCKFGEVDTKIGVTKKAKGHYAFEKEHKESPLYHKLKRPFDWYIGLVGDTVILNLVYASCEKLEWDNWNKAWKDSNVFLLNQQRSTNHYSYIPLADFTSQLIYDIITYEPRTIMDNKVIVKYTNEIIPRMLFDLRRLLPEVYNQLLIDYPEVKNIIPDFKGRTAKIASLANGIELKTHSGIWFKEGEYLISNNYRPAFLAFNAKSCEAKIKITDEMTYEIDNNSQVDENTEFV